LAIDPADGPAIPPFPPGLEDQISPSLWRVVEVVESAVDDGALVIDPGSSDPAEIDLTNIAVANVTQGGMIRVYADVNTIAQPALDAIVALGAEIVSANDFLSIVEAWVPFDQVDELAGLASVDLVRLPLSAVLQTGMVNTAGDGILNADDIRTQLNVDGTGIRIGVISDGVDNRALVQGGANPDLPAITVNPARPGTGDEGTAILEIIHDLAPGAQLFFSSGITGQVAMVDSINWLIGQGVDVIVDDLGFFAEHYFSDDPIAQTVDAAVNGGVTYLTSAGNQAQLHYQGQWSVSTGSAVHDFDPTGAEDELLDIGVVPAGGVINVFLQWSDAQGSSGNDYNLGLWNVTNGGFVANSVDIQTGTQNPFEGIQWTNLTGAPVQVAVVVDDTNTPAGRELELFVLPRNFALANLIDDDRTTLDSVFGHAAVVDAISVAAIDAADPGNDTIEFFSNQGASTIFTNFATQTSVTRDTVDGAGIDGVETRIGQLGFFNNPFFGTSAAAPHVAAVAALLLDINPSLTPAQVSTVLNSTAVDIGVAGYDNESGFGRFDALAAADTTLATLGDYDRDQDVDGADFLAWQRGFGSIATPVGSGADGDLSGAVGAGDLSVWESNFGEAIPAAVAASSVTASASSIDTSSPPEEPLIEASFAEEFSTLASDLAFDEIVQSFPTNLLFTNSQSVMRVLGTELASIRSSSFDNAIASTTILNSALRDLPFSQTSEERESHFPALSDREDLEGGQNDMIQEPVKAFDASFLDQLI